MVIDSRWSLVIGNKPCTRYTIDCKPGTLHRNQRRDDTDDLVQIMARHHSCNSLDPAAHCEVILQESPSTHDDGHGLEETNESSAGRIDYFHRFGSCLLRNPGQSLVPRLLTSWPRTSAVAVLTDSVLGSGPEPKCPQPPRGCLSGSATFGECWADWYDLLGVLV